MVDWYNDWANNHLPKPDTQGEKERKRREYHREYRKRNHEKLRQYHAEYYREHKEKWQNPRPEHPYKNCEVCGAPFYPFHFSDKYCCARCRRKA